MSTERLIFIIGVIFFVLSVCVFLYTAIAVIGWKESIDKKVTTLTEGVSLTVTKTKHLEDMVTINDNALSRYEKTMEDILEHNDQIIKDNNRLSNELSFLALSIRGARDESTDVSDDGSGSDDTTL